MTSAPPPVSGALAGLATGLSGLAVSHALTRATGARATPVLAVAEAVIEVTPGPVAEVLIALTGTFDKPILVTVVVLVLLGLSAWAGALGRHRRNRALLVFLAMGVLGLVAALTRPQAGPLDAVPVVAGTVTWVAVLPLLLDSAHRQHERRGPDEARRRVLVTAGLVAGVAVAVGLAGELAGRSRRGVESARRLLRLPVTRGRVPRGARLDVPGIGPWRTPTAEFYRIDTALVVPAIDPTDWRLRIHGMVEREIEVSYNDLVARSLTEDWVTLACVSNEVGGDLIGNAWWSGVRVAELLAEAGVHPDADAVLQTSEDGWTCGTPLQALTDGRNALLAIGMNGEPLPVEHGFPVRMVVPGLYGYVSATKWLVDLEVSRFDRFTAYWTEKGWAAQGPVRTQSRVDVPRAGAEVDAGTVRVGGAAWAQHTGVARVEYRLDGGPWREATLGYAGKVDTWVQWEAELEVAPGPHTLAVRATDRSGYTQTGVRRDVVPDGATGWHTVEFDAR